MYIPEGAIFQGGLITIFLEKKLKWRILDPGCARRGASGALCPKSALCGAEFPPEGLILGYLGPF